MERELKIINRQLDTMHRELHLIFQHQRKNFAALRGDKDEEAAADALLAEIEKATDEIPTD